LIEGVHFYNDVEEGLGEYFLACLYSDIESLKIFGGIHPKPHRHFHRALSRRFPFAIFYTVDDDVVRVRTIVDCRRKPSWVRQHLKDS
jgi:hypothetical protein